ncbi:ABC transporter ATP-binding protein [Amycolatopsis sp. WQ 127309]|uniref:ABC transporter ATP-binding protein n=1 Tax=Amycolatopsis sp. WQ 127309 TaxID=2932773 RepID=UPI001FF6D612|nr:ABC transporter ATP-binding protein [Amycolatopsis sp. WQ 127309]UOZ05407.1 ABC transporter ATP-binding protein [Amycolatopsis sp. WQ 127309]
MSAGLVVENLGVAYRTAAGEVRAVDDVSLTVAKGRMLGIVGESGSGKTTIARALGGHLPAGGRIVSGRITAGGVDVLGLSRRDLRTWRRRDLAFVHQEAGGALDPTMRVGAQLAEALALQDVPRPGRRERAAGLLDRVRLPASVARRYPHELSGGQQQRVVIAAALAKQPKLLVLDEPTTGLDASVEWEILTLLDRLRRELAVTVVLISHDLDLVGRLCDDIAVLYAGRGSEFGPADAVLRGPAHPYTAALLACAPEVGVPRSVRRLAAIPGAPATAADGFSGCRFATRCAFADDLCRTTEPGVTEFAPGRTVRCHHAERLAPLPVRPDASFTRKVPPQGPLDASFLAKVTSPGAPDGSRLGVDGLTAGYGGRPVVRDVTFEIRPAEVFGLVGESGSGKTTLARTIAGLGPGAGAGTMTLSGADLPASLGRRRSGLRRRVQMVFQQPEATLNPAQRVGTVLRRAIRTLGGTGTARELAERVQLGPDLLTARTTALSGGQQQRVAIARAFAGRPDLVICDEPVSALDVSVQAGVLELLARQRETTDTSVLFISHDLAVVGYLADRVGVLYRGRLVETGRTADVLAGPHHPYTDLLVTAAHRAEVTEAPRRADTGAGCVFAAGCPHHLGPLCDDEPPPARDLGNGHDVRCHLPADRLPQSRPLAAEKEPR